METNPSLSRQVMRHHLSAECSRLYYISITDVSDHSARSLLTISARPTLENGRISLVSITSLLHWTPSLKYKKKKTISILFNFVIGSGNCNSTTMSSSRGQKL